MKLKDNKSKLRYYIAKLESICDLYGSDSLRIGFDRLDKKKRVDFELLYFLNGESEKKGIFVFSYISFVKELKDQGLKKILSHNILNFRIHSAYRRLSKKDGDMVCINDIINLICKNDPTISRSKILTRVMALAYYHGWRFERKEGAIDTDYCVAIPSDFRCRMKQRFNVDMYKNLVDDRDVQLFINNKGDLVFVFKQKDDFTRVDIEKVLGSYLKDEFKIKKISFDK